MSLKIKKKKATKGGKTKLEIRTTVLFWFQ